MRRKNRLKQRAQRLNCNKFRRILRIYRLKLQIYNRHRIGFVILKKQP